MLQRIKKKKFINSNNKESKFKYQIINIKLKYLIIYKNKNF